MFKENFVPLQTVFL